MIDRSKCALSETNSSTCNKDFSHVSRGHLSEGKHIFLYTYTYMSTGILIPADLEL